MENTNTEIQTRKLNRYTSLPILLDMLRRKKLVLLDPSSWEDRNDSQIIQEYKERKQLQQLYAVCFSIGDETIHHWKTYASGISGCCIEFDEMKLLRSLQGIKEIRYGDVIYRKLKEVRNSPIDVDRIPFTKRYPYRVENEFRILWEQTTEQEQYEPERKHIEIDIDLSSINRITISQNMPMDIFNTIIDLLREGNETSKSIINRSTLFENQVWIDTFKDS